LPYVTEFQKPGAAAVWGVHVSPGAAIDDVTHHTDTPNTATTATTAIEPIANRLRTERIMLLPGPTRTSSSTTRT